MTNQFVRFSWYRNRKRMGIWHPFSAKQRSNITYFRSIHYRTAQFITQEYIYERICNGKRQCPIREVQLDLNQLTSIGEHLAHPENRCSRNAMARSGLLRGCPACQRSAHQWLVCRCVIGKKEAKECSSSSSIPSISRASARNHLHSCNHY